jgi:ferrous iron transport protein A
MTNERGRAGREIPLDRLVPGGQGFVSRIEGGRGLMRRLTAMGLLPGTKVHMLKRDFHGPMIVRIHEARLALGRGMAHHVWVTTGPEVDAP